MWTRSLYTALGACVLLASSVSGLKAHLGDVSRRGQNRANEAVRSFQEKKIKSRADNGTNYRFYNNATSSQIVHSILVGACG